MNNMHVVHTPILFIKGYRRPSFKWHCGVISQVFVTKKHFSWEFAYDLSTSGVKLMFRPEQKSQFSDDILNVFSVKNLISFAMWLEFVVKGNISAFLELVVWCERGDRLLLDPTMIYGSTGSQRVKCDLWTGSSLVQVIYCYQAIT